MWLEFSSLKEEVETFYVSVFLDCTKLHFLGMLTFNFSSTT